ncbi:L,D-transpeptidase [Acuticoccus mangrovi]|uniref:L,D-transpeptidase n=1 Tax=Acuticoccus mangrovi TaxID=2796142 RepID=A0A934IL44_9HYPH|nr:L,D-transpeptidase [Acuticoccus mangrovi]MBJ3774277.1 L,D-transpeptidase [Acuticoccus mangrovi]
MRLLRAGPRVVRIGIVAAAVALGAGGAHAGTGLTLSDLVLGQSHSMLKLPAEAAPVFEAKRERVVVDMKNRRMFFRAAGEADVRLYRVGIGRPEAHIPLGRTRITSKRVDPSWWPTPRARQRDPYLPAVMKSGADNPLGTRAMNLSWKYYLIHGTNDARKVGRAATWGCVSMYESEVQAFFSAIDQGMRVRFEPTLDERIGHAARPVAARGTVAGPDGDS